MSLKLSFLRAQFCVVLFRLRGGEQKCAKKYGVGWDRATTAVSPDQMVSDRNLLTCFEDSPYVGL